MRILFENKSIKFWIDNFPCRLIENDMISINIIPEIVRTEIADKLDNENVIITNLLFDCDNLGIFQHAIFEYCV